MAQHPLVGQGLVIIEASRSHSRHTTPRRIHLEERSAQRRGLRLARNNTHRTQTSMPPGGIQTRNPSKRAAKDPRLRTRSHWNPSSRYFNKSSLFGVPRHHSYKV